MKRPHFSTCLLLACVGLTGSSAWAQVAKESLTFKGHTTWVYSVAFSPDGKKIVSGCADGPAKVWDAATGKEILSLQCGRVGVRSVAFSPDGKLIVTGSSPIKVWDVATGQETL